MQNFVAAVRQAVAAGNIYAALALALALPDMCGALVSPKARPSDRYKAWWIKYVKPAYTAAIGAGREEHVFLGESDAYALRCAVLHQGYDDLAEHQAREALDRFHFVEPESGMLHCNQYNRVLNLQVSVFCEDIAKGVEAFMIDTADDEGVQQRLRGILTIGRGSGFEF